VGEQIGEQLQRFAFCHADDALGADRVQIERLAAGFGMRPDQRMGDRIGHFRGFRQVHQLPFAEAALVDVDRPSAGDPGLRRWRQVVIGAVHVDILRVAAVIGERCGALPGDIAPPVGVVILVRDVVDQRAFGQRKFGIVLREHLAEQLRRAE
jgi:hypothetical protein